MTRHMTTHALTFPPPVRDPRIQVLAMASLLGGIGLALGGPKPSTLEAVLPWPLLVVWGIGLIVSGAGFIVAALWRDVITGVLIEGYACVITLLCFSAYAFGVWAVLGWDGAVQPVFITLAYGLGCGWRARDIARDLRSVHARVRDHADAAEADSWPDP